MRSESDIITFYSIFYPDYPEILSKAIAKRIAGIIEKSRSGETLTEDEKGYVVRSKNTREDIWDPKEEMKEQEKQGLIRLSMNKLE